MGPPPRSYRLTEAQREMAAAYLPMAENIVGKYIMKKKLISMNHRDDAMEVAMDALCYGCHSWESGHRVAVATFLGICVERAIWRWMARRDCPLGFRSPRRRPLAPKTAHLGSPGDRYIYDVGPVDKRHAMVDPKSGDPADILAAREVAALAFGLLNDRERRVFVMAYRLDLNNEEIAAEMSLTRERVRQIRSRALKRIREAIHAA